MRISFWSALVLFVLAVGLYAASYLYYHRYDWVTAKVAIDAAQEKSYDIDFVSQYDGDYTLGMEFQVSGDPSSRKELECRAGIGTGVKSHMAGCSEFPEKLTLNWSIYQGSKLIGRDSCGAEQIGKDQLIGGQGVFPRCSWGHSSRESIGKNLVRFSSQKGERYKIRVVVKRGDKELSIYNPVIKVTMGQRAHKDAFVQASLGVMAAYLCVAIGLLVMFVGFVLSFFWKRRQST